MVTTCCLEKTPENPFAGTRLASYDDLMSYVDMVSQYGYIAIFVGTFLEGEAILILGGIAAHQGYLDPVGVIATACCAALLGDSLFYYLGRSLGARLFIRFPKIGKRAERVADILQKHRIPLLLGFRFLYGTRIASPLAIGAARIKPLLFHTLESIGALTWSVVIGLAGYFFGSALESLFGKLRHEKAAIVLTLAALATIIWFVVPFLRSRRLRRTS